MGLTRATVNRILQRHAATETLVPGKSKGLLGGPHITSSIPCFVQNGSTGSHHKCSGLDIMDEEFAWNFNCQPPLSPLIEWAQSWQNLTMANWQHVIFGNKSRFQLYLAYLVSASSKGARLIGSKLVVFRCNTGELFTVVLNRLLCSPTGTSPVSSTGAFCETL